MGNESWMQTGVGDLKKIREQAASQFRPEFWLRDDNDVAKILVLDKEPLRIPMHQFKLRDKLKKYTCPGKGCPLCKVNEARLLWVYRIIDTRSYEDKQKKVHENTERYYEIGLKLMAQVEALEEDDHWFGKIVKVKRVGTGTKTTYVLQYSAEPKRLPKPTLKWNIDYKPKPLSELQTLAELLGAKDDDGDSHSGGSSSNTSRYYEEDDEDEKPKKPAGSKFKKKTPEPEPEEEEDQDAGADDSDAEPVDEDDNETPF